MKGGAGKRAGSGRRLPHRLRPLFWEYHFSRLTWERDRDLVIGRILASGDWEAVKWVRSRAGDEGLREWLERRRGGGLTRAQLRFWELVLRLPRRKVNAWLTLPGRQVWDRRVNG